MFSSSVLLHTDLYLKEEVKTITCKVWLRIPMSKSERNAWHSAGIWCLVQWCNIELSQLLSECWMTITFDVWWQESSHCIALWLCKLNDHHMHNYNHYLHKLSSQNTTLCLILMLHCITNVNGSGSCREKPSFFIICHGLPFPSSYKSCKNHNYFTMRSNIDDWLWLARRVTI